MTGALHSPGGHAVVALRAWHDKTDSSSVVPVLSNPVTSFQHSAVVSEHGCSGPVGALAAFQAQHLVDEVGDPRGEAGLAEAARRLGQGRDFDECRPASRLAAGALREDVMLSSPSRVKSRRREEWTWKPPTT